MRLMDETMWINHNQLNVSLFIALKENQAEDICVC